MMHSGQEAVKERVTQSWVWGWGDFRPLVGGFLGGLWFLLSGPQLGWKLCALEGARESKLLLPFSGQERLEQALGKVLSCDRTQWAQSSCPTFLEILQVLTRRCLSSHRVGPWPFPEHPAWWGGGGRKGCWGAMTDGWSGA